MLEGRVLEHLRRVLVETVLFFENFWQLSPSGLELVACKLEEHEAYHRVAVLLNAPDPAEGNAAVPERILQREPLLLIALGPCHR